MGRKPQNVEKISVNLRKGDVKKLSEIFGGRPYAKYVRQLVSNFVDKHYVTPDVEPAGEIDLTIEPKGGFNHDDPDS